MISTEFFYISILLLTGAGVGLATGLLGVGGGFILVPVQFFLLQSLGLDPTNSMRIALGTSLAVILPTAISSAYGHYTKKTVLWKSALYLGLAGISGAFMGGLIATNIPADYIRIIFGLVLMLVIIQMSLYHSPTPRGHPVQNNFHLIFWGVVAGILSGLLGIGGGVILIPIMILMFGFNILEAIGTSTAVIVFTSIGGIISYIYAGWGVMILPYSVGYVNLLQFIILTGVSIPMAQAGVYAAHKLPERKLRYIFMCILFYISFKMLGVFQWLGLPL